MSAPVTVSRQRLRNRRCGSWQVFERRFQPMEAPSHSLLWDRAELPATLDPHHWWTVLDCDGRLYVTPGFRFVNRFAFIRCAIPWTEHDETNTDYLYD